MNLSHRCRACGESLRHSVVNLGLSPFSNALIRPENLHQGEMFYPLHTKVCESCWLVQLVDVTKVSDHFHDDYVYFSSFSSSWLTHSRRYVEDMVLRFGLGIDSQVIELASNDGYLLQYFVHANIPCLGIEPSSNTAAAARALGVPTREIFFGRDAALQLAAEGSRADLLIGNNVLAHVPDLNDFVGGMPLVLKPDGVITLEFPHLMSLIRENQFDTIYHEHYSYLSLFALQPIFQRAGLRVFDVEKLPTHGGSLRIFVCHKNAFHQKTGRIALLEGEEREAGMTNLSAFTAFNERVYEIKRDLLEFLIAAKRSGRRVAAYGAAAKGNTLLNYCGIGSDFIDFVADKNPHKQGRFLPGTRIPIFSPERIFSEKPDDVLIFPWNIKNEIMSELAEVRNWGGRFVVPIPHLEVL